MKKKNFLTKKLQNYYHIKDLDESRNDNTTHHLDIFNALYVSNKKPTYDVIVADYATSVSALRRCIVRINELAEKISKLN